MRFLKTLRTRGLAVFLALVMCLGMLPTAALAAEETYPVTVEDFTGFPPSSSSEDWEARRDAADKWSGSPVGNEFWDQGLTTPAKVGISGGGTSGNPYKIKTAEQLAWIECASIKNAAYRKAWYSLENDIDLCEKEWLPIGRTSYDAGRFCGKFLGNGHVIFGLKQVGTGSQVGGVDRNTVGLFGYISSGAEICNLTIYGAEITNKKTTSGYSPARAGALVMAATTSTAGTPSGSVLICNCHVVNSTVEAQDQAGGLIGDADKQTTSGSISVEIRRCSFTGGTVKTVESSNSAYTGGIIGGDTYANKKMSNAKLTLSRCYSVGATIIGGGLGDKSGTGGIIGGFDLQDNNVDAIRDCFNSSTVITLKGINSAGGIVGKAPGKGRLTRCYNSGIIKGPTIKDSYTNSVAKYFGGIVGRCDNPTSLTLNNCYNAGSIQGLIPEDDYVACAGPVFGGSYNMSTGNWTNPSASTDVHYLADSATSESGHVNNWPDNGAVSTKAELDEMAKAAFAEGPWTGLLPNGCVGQREDGTGTCHCKPSTESIYVGFRVKADNCTWSDTKTKDIVYPLTGGKLSADQTVPTGMTPAEVPGKTYDEDSGSWYKLSEDGKSVVKVEDPAEITDTEYAESTLYVYAFRELTALTDITKTLVTDAEEIQSVTLPDGVTLSEKNAEGKYVADADGNVVLLYRITVTGEAGAKFTVTDENSRFVNPEGESWTGELKATDSPAGDGKVSKTNYVVRTFADVTGEGTVVNTAYLKPGDGTSLNPSDPSKKPVEEDGEHKGDLPVDADPVSVTPAETDYVLIYDANGGEFEKDTTTRYTKASGAESVEFPVASITPGKNGYVLAGWSDTVDGGVDYAKYDKDADEQAKVTVAKADTPKTVYAVWEKFHPEWIKVTKKALSFPDKKEITEVQVGETFQYCIKLDNIVSTRIKVTITDRLDGKLMLDPKAPIPDSGKFDKNTCTVTWDDVEVSANGGKEMTVYVVATAAGPINNTAVVTWTDLDKDLESNPVTVEAKANVEITKELAENSPDSYTVGDTIAWTIKVTNKGAFKLENLEVSDTLKTGTGTVTVTGKNNVNPNSFALEPGASVEFTASVVTAAEGKYQNHAEVRFKDQDPEEDPLAEVDTEDPNNPTVDPVQNPKLKGITKTQLEQKDLPTGVTLPAGVTLSRLVNGKYKANADGEVTLLYEITVTGDKGANYIVSDEDSLFVGGEGEQTAKGQPVTGVIGESGKAEIYVVRTFAVDDDKTGKVSNTAYVKPGDDATDPIDPKDPDAGHPSTPAENPVTPADRHLDVKKTMAEYVEPDSSNPVKPADEDWVTFTVKVKNDGERTLYNLMLVDTMDETLALVSDLTDVAVKKNGDNTNPLEFRGTQKLFTPVRNNELIVWTDEGGVTRTGGPETKWDHTWTLKGEFVPNAEVEFSYTVKILYPEGTSTVKFYNYADAIAGNDSGSVPEYTPPAAVDPASGTFRLESQDVQYSGGFTTGGAGTGSSGGDHVVGERTRYQLIYDYNGGTGADGQTTIRTDTQFSNTGSYTFTVSGEVPVRQDFVFKGWKDGASTHQNGATITVGKENTPKTISAIWEPQQPDTVTVTFNPNGGSWGGITISQTVIVEKGKTIAAGSSQTVPPDPTNGAARFLGWYTEKDGGTEVDPETAAFSENTVLYARWQDQYTYTLNCYDGSSRLGETPYGPTAETSHTFTVSNPTQAGHTFLGWAASASGDVVYPVDENQDTIGIQLSSTNPTKTVYAVWEENTGTDTTEVTWEMPEGTDPVTKDVPTDNIGGTEEKPTVPDGYYPTNPGGGDWGEPEKNPDGSITIPWVPDSEDTTEVTWEMPEGTDPVTKDVPTDDIGGTEENPTVPDGYYPGNPGGGDWGAPEKNPDGTITIPWVPDNPGPDEPDVVTVTWEDWDGTILQGPVDWNKAESEPAYTGGTPTQPADDSFTYAFTHWEKSEDITGNITYTAQYSRTPIDPINPGDGPTVQELIDLGVRVRVRCAVHGSHEMNPLAGSYAWDPDTMTITFDSAFYVPAFSQLHGAHFLQAAGHDLTVRLAPAEEEPIPENGLPLILNPADEEIISQPADEEVIPQPEDEEVIPQPEDEEVILQPADEEVIPQPEDEEVILQPADEEVIPQPEDEEVIPQPEDEEVTPEPDDEEVIPEPEEDTDLELNDLFVAGDPLTRFQLAEDETGEAVIYVYCNTTYTLSYNANGGYGAPDTQYVTGPANGAHDTTVSSTAPTLSGYRFQGWSLSSSGAVNYQPGSPISLGGDTTLYAVWSRRSTGGGGGTGGTGGTGGGGGTGGTGGTGGGGGTGGTGGTGGGGGTGGTGGTTGGTTTINDDAVPLAGDLQLNKQDHFAYIKGYQDGTVRPNNPLTRAHVATIFYRLLDETSRTIFFQETNDFSDVFDDFWANKAISTLTNAGIITGFQDGTFRPNAYITRAQFAAIAARFDNVVPGLENPFSDVSEDYWARDLIAYAASKGWIDGSNGKFRPLENITRVEAMDFINNVLDRHVDEQGILAGVTTFTDVPVTDPSYYVVEEATNSHDYTRRTEGQLMENWTQLNPDPVWEE